MKRCLQLSILFLFMAVFIPRGVGAEEILTWQDCVKEAQKNHPDLISAQEAVKQAKAEKMITTSAILPQISSELSETTSKSTSKTRSDTYGYGVSAQQLLFDGLKTPYEITAAAKNVTAAQYTYDATSADIRLRLRTAFIGLLKAQELLTITTDIAARRRQNADLVRLLYEGGREHRGSLLTAQANLAQAEFEVAQAQRALAVSQRQLGKELGRPHVKPIQVREDIEHIAAKRERPAFEALATSNPSLEALAKKSEAAKFHVKSAKARFFPEIFANAHIGRTDSNWPPMDDEWSVGVTLTFPIFEGGRRLAEVSKARAVLNQAQADERSGRDGVILTLEERWSNWQNAIDTVTVQKKFLQAAEERAKITQAQYSNGLISFDNWTIIEDDLVKTRKYFLDSQTNAFIAQAQWIQAQGGSLEYVE